MLKMKYSNSKYHRIRKFISKEFYTFSVSSQTMHDLIRFYGYKNG